MDYFKHKNRIIWHVLLIPFIWMVFIPLVILDVFISLYHLITFPIYGFKYLKRVDYVLIDRHKLKYLNLWQKLNCVYCGYANGLLKYALKIAAMTEKYWCGIRHKSRDGFNEPNHHKDFIDYDDEEAFNNTYVR